VTPFRVALEITPPMQPNPDVLLRRASLLGDAASAVHVIARPGRQASLDASITLERAGRNAVWHVPNRGRNSAELEREIERAAHAGIRSALVVRGEGDLEDRPDTPTLRALVARIRAAIPTARIGVTLNPYLDPERVLANLWPKLEAGADFVQTQPVFFAASLHGVAERIRARAPRVEILPMVIPLVSAAAAEKLALRLRVPLGDALVARLARGGSEAGWTIFAETISELQASALADGIALMTLEMDPPAEVGERVLRAVRLPRHS
jgi:5,10-methylenetetrahydrofolate reductase